MTLSHQFWRIFLGGIFYPKTKYSSDKSFNTYQDDWMLNWLVSKMYDTIYVYIAKHGYVSNLLARTKEVSLTKNITQVVFSNISALFNPPRN